VQRQHLRRDEHGPEREHGQAGHRRLGAHTRPNLPAS
jgi:hypothetical protein